MKKEQLNENRRILEKQIQEQQMRKFITKNEHKLPTNTTFGPVESDELSTLLRNKRLQELNLTKVALMEQMKQKTDKREQKFQVERELENINLQRVNQLLDTVKQEEKDKSNKAK